MTKRLLDFAPIGEATLKVLVIESEELILPLKERLPESKLYVVTAFEEVTTFSEFNGLDISWRVYDWRQKHLPFPENFFDAIIGAGIFEHLWDSYSTLMDINRRLKETGAFVADFLNIRYHKILSGLKEGSYPYRDSRLYAKEEVVRMLNDALFKEIDFAPLEVDEDEEAASYWENLGFTNYSRDLATKSWMLRAGKSTAAVAALKSLYTPEERRRLATLLRRIEYDIDREKNLEELRKLIEELSIFPEYLSDFIASTSARRLTRPVLPCDCEV